MARTSVSETAATALAARSRHLLESRLPTCADTPATDVGATLSSSTPRPTSSGMISGSAAAVVATEVQSELRRLEQQLRWSHEKAESLPSADFWRFLERPPRIDRVLVLRSTRTNRDLARRFSETLAVAFPASPIDAFRALTQPDVEWPGSALLWASVEGDTASILERPPRLL